MAPGAMFFVVATAAKQAVIRVNETTVENYLFNENPQVPTPGTFEHTFTVPDRHLLPYHLPAIGPIQLSMMSLYPNQLRHSLL